MLYYRKKYWSKMKFTSPIIHTITVLLLLSLSLLAKAELLSIPAGLCKEDKANVEHGVKLSILDEPNGTWFANEKVECHPELMDWNNGSIAFSLMVLHLPDNDRELFIAGDISKKNLRTLKISLHSDGRIEASHFSWHNNQRWYEPLVSEPLVKPYSWIHVRYSWGASGRELRLDGKPVATATQDTKDVSWAFDLVFPTSSCFFSEATINENDRTRNRDVDLNKLLPNDAAKLFENGKTIEEQGRRLELLEKKLGRLPYEHATLAILRYFTAQHCETFLKAGNNRTLPSIFQPEEQDIAWMTEELPALARRLDELESGKVEPLQSPLIEADRKKISYRDGAFFQHDRPIFLVGVQDFWPLSGQIGFSATSWTFSAVWEFPDSPNNLRSTGEDHLKAARKAGQHGQFWDELYSVHIRPKWFNKEHPKLGVGLGYVGSDVTHPVSKELDRKVFESVLPKLCEAENFLFLDLANEPAYNGVTEYGEKEFRDFLKQKHGNIKKLNDAWGTSYRGFEGIRIPPFVNKGWAAHDRQQKPSGEIEQRQYLDWSEFNCRRFNDFFANLVSLAKTISPEILTYTKVVAGYWPWAGVDPVANARTTDVSGSDAWWVYQGISGPVGSSDAMSGHDKAMKGFAVNWTRSLMHYDMLRSARPDAPIVNAEDHLFADTFKPLSEEQPVVPSGHWDMPIPYDHFYSGQWQQAIHGKGYSLLWTHWPRHNIHQRAVATFANSRAALDLNRLGSEIQAFRTVVPEIRLLLSRTTELWDFSLQKGYMKRMTDLYRALSLNGVDIGFVFEEDLIEGKTPQGKLLFVSGVGHIDSKALAALKKSKMTIVSLGKESLLRDRYNRPYSEKDLPTFRQIKEDAFAAEPLKTIRSVLQKLDLESDVGLFVNGKPAEQIEWRTARHDGNLLVNIAHYGQLPIKVRMGKKSGGAVDLITMEKMDLNDIPFRSQQVRLLKIVDVKRKP